MVRTRRRIRIRSSAVTADRVRDHRSPRARQGLAMVATPEPRRCPSRVLPTSIAVLCSLVVACAHPQATNRKPSADNDLATRLVAWDVVRRRAELNLLTIPLPSIALRQGAIADDGIQQVAVVAVLRLSPHFATVAMAWPTICERRGVLPDDVFNYAMAWCRYARDGTGDLDRVLVGLMSSTVPGLRAAALDDLANVVADAHDAATAMRILDKVTPPPGTLDKLATIYSGLGREEDEAVVRTHLPPPPPPQTGCSELNTALETFVPQSLTKIRTVAAGSTNCASLARSLVCRIAVVSEPTPSNPVCARAASTPSDDREIREAHYLAAYAQWGTDWFAVVDHAVKAMPEPGAEQVAIAALSASLRSGCTPSRLREVHERADLLLREPAHEARWTPTLLSLATTTPKICEGLPVAARTSP